MESPGSWRQERSSKQRHGGGAGIFLYIASEWAAPRPPQGRLTDRPESLGGSSGRNFSGALQSLDSSNPLPTKTATARPREQADWGPEDEDGQEVQTARKPLEGTEQRTHEDWHGKGGNRPTCRQRFGQG